MEEDEEVDGFVIKLVVENVGIVFEELVLD